MRALTSGDLRIEPDEADPATIRLIWHGKSNHRQPAAILMPYFNEILDTASARGSAISMSFLPLEHLNSSTISCLIQLIQQAEQRGVKLALEYNPLVRWQALSFHALSALTRPSSAVAICPTSPG
jgi:hypothetical protein